MSENEVEAPDVILRIKDLQHEQLVRVDQNALQAQAVLVQAQAAQKLVIDAILASHDLAVAEPVSVGRDEDGYFMVVKVPE